MKVRTRLALTACAAAIGCAFSAPVAAQQAETQNSIERAMRTPLEIVWLQSQIQADMWRQPGMGAAQGCERPGAPKEGCAVPARTGWRYIFGASAPSHATPLFFSDAGARLSIAGTGKVYLVPGEKAPAVVLAAGTVVQIMDAAFPSIQIEIKAPADEPLNLGNLASADIRNVIALIARQPAVQASAAQVLQTGKVAFRAPGVQPAVAVAQREPLHPELPALAAALEISAPIPAFDIAAADLSSFRIDVPQPVAALAQPDPLAGMDFSPLTATVEVATLVPEVPFDVAAANFAALSGRFDVPQPLVTVIAPDPLAGDFSLLASAVEAATKLEPGFDVAAADLSSLSGLIDVPQALTPAPQPTAQVAVASSDLARMRAEIEAEIARERERLAQSLQPAAKRVRFGT
jgi:hypothetical protein